MAHTLCAFLMALLALAFVFCFCAVIAFTAGVSFVRIAHVRSIWVIK
jgi:hypothetical protein